MTATPTFRTIHSTWSMWTSGYDECDWELHPFDDRCVGHAAAFAHGLQAEATAAALELVDQSGHEPRARAAERVTDGYGAAVDVHLAHVGVVLLLPREHDG